MSVHAPADLQVGDLVIQQMWSPTDPSWSSTIDERIAAGHRYGNDRLMRVASIRPDQWLEQYDHLSGHYGPHRPYTGWHLVDPDRPRDESRMSWVNSDWCVLVPAIPDGALF